MQSYRPFEDKDADLYPSGLIGAFVFGQRYERSIHPVSYPASDESNRDSCPDKRAVQPALHVTVIMYVTPLHCCKEYQTITTQVLIRRMMEEMHEPQKHARAANEVEPPWRIISEVY